MDTKTTEQAAAELGLSQPSLLNYLSRHPHLKPVTQTHKRGALLWTDEEIAAVRTAKNMPSKAGRPKRR
jgi:hypothetical protein